MSQLINMTLIRKSKDNPTSKLVIVKKESDGTKSFQYVDDLKFSYYIDKPDHVKDGMRNFVPIENVNRIICRYDDLYKNMAMNSPNPNIKTHYKQAMNAVSDCYKMLRQMHLDFSFHGTDKNIVDAYITKFYSKNNPDDNLFGLKKAYLDIEVDGSDIIGFPRPEEALAAINVITVTVDNNNVYSYCLKYDTDTYKECMRDKESLYRELKDKYKERGLGDMNFHIYEYDDEIDLIKACFDMINNVERPDMVLG